MASAGDPRWDWLIAAATLLFVEPRRADRARSALRKALGGNRLEHPMGLLAFIRTAHYWTVLHPELSFEDDVRNLLKVNEELARLLLEDQEAATRGPAYAEHRGRRCVAQRSPSSRGDHTEVPAFSSASPPQGQ
jgi:hypothetical protein